MEQAVNGIDLLIGGLKRLTWCLDYFENNSTCLKIYINNSTLVANLDNFRLFGIPAQNASVTPPPTPASIQVLFTNLSDSSFSV